MSAGVFGSLSSDESGYIKPLNQATERSLMSESIHLLDVVALTGNTPRKNLLRGQVGTVVETLAPGVYEVEFCDDAGRTFAMAAVRDTQMMVLRYRPARTA